MKKKKHQLPRMEKNVLHLKFPVDMGEGEIIATIEFDEEMSGETFNLLKADHTQMTNQDWIVIGSKLCNKSPHFLLQRLSKPDKRLLVDYIAFLHLVAA